MLDLSCVDWQERIRAGHSLVPKAAHGINQAKYDQAVKIFNKLRLPDVEGMPFLADAAGEWFREIIGVFLGSIDPVTKARLIRELFLLVAKKQNKTTGGAALMLTALLMNERPRAEFLFIAPTKAIAEIAFSQAVGMIKADNEGFLQKRLFDQDHLKTITDRRTKAKLKIKTFDTSVLTGVKPAGVLIDELHEIAKDAKASKIIGQLRGGMLPIPEAFMAFITTQSDDAPRGAFKSELILAREIRDGTATGAMLPILYEFPDAIMRDKTKPIPAWGNPENWPMVLPNAGRSMTVERLIEEFAAAKQKGEEEIRRWGSQHLNIEIGVALSTDAWRGAEHWEACGDATLTLDELIRRSEIVCVGIDGGGLDDLLGMAVVGRCRKTRKLLLWNHAWAHQSVLDRRKDIVAQLKDFEEDGDLTICQRVGDDVIAVNKIVRRLEAEGLLPEEWAVGVDQIGISSIVKALTGPGAHQIDAERIGGVPQGYRLNGAIKDTERDLAAGDIVHGASNLMAWCVGNAKTEQKGNALSITKQASGSAKIDPLAATFDAMVALSQNPDSGGSIWDRDDLWEEPEEQKPDEAAILLPQ